MRDKARALFGAAWSAASGRADGLTAPAYRLIVDAAWRSLEPSAAWPAS
jgi:hypothetical protein